MYGNPEHKEKLPEDVPYASSHVKLIPASLERTRAVMGIDSRVAELCLAEALDL